MALTHGASHKNQNSMVYPETLNAPEPKNNTAGGGCERVGIASRQKLDDICAFHIGRSGLQDLPSEELMEVQRCPVSRSAVNFPRGFAGIVFIATPFSSIGFQMQASGVFKFCAKRVPSCTVLLGDVAQGQQHALLHCLQSTYIDMRIRIDEQHR
jgi:hypothetical protein